MPGHVIQAVGEGNHLPVHVGLRHLFEAAMQIADLGIGIDDALAVHGNLQPERSVHCGMLRPEIQNLRMIDAHRFGVFLGAFDHGQIDRLGAHGALAGREVASQRMTFKLRMRQNAAQIRMALELNSEHVERFALRPVRALPHIDDAVDRGILAGHRRLDAHAMFVRKRKQMIDHVVAVGAFLTGNRRP